MAMADAQQAFDALSDTEKEQFKKSIVEPPTGENGRVILWVIGLVLLGGALFVFGILAYMSSDDSGGRTAFLAVATTALGLLGGLFAPSPVS